MANPYPALITDANSETRIAGQINFTDPANQPGGGSSVVTEVTAVLTPAMIQGAHVTPVELAPAPGAGKAYIDAVSLFVFGAGFSPYGGVFTLKLLLGAPDEINQVFVSNVSGLHSALTGAGETDVVGEWFGGLVQESWSGPVALLDNCPYNLEASAAPTGGAGNITVVSAMTTITLP